MESVEIVINKFLANLKSQTQDQQTSTLKTSDNMESNNCRECGGTGFIQVEYNTYRACVCQEVEKVKKMLEKSGISEQYQKINFQGYKPHNAATQQAKAKAAEYVMDFDNIKLTRQNSIALLGQVGSGKTHLSIAIANNLMSKGIPVLYMPYRDAVTELKQNMIDEEYYQNQIQRYKSTKILLIDDLFKGKVNDSDKNIMFEVINHRYLNKAPIIVSSEYTLERLVDFDEAIGSRIIEMCRNYLVVFKGQENNYRLRGIV